MRLGVGAGGGVEGISNCRFCRRESRTSRLMGELGWLVTMLARAKGRT